MRYLPIISLCAALGAAVPEEAKVWWSHVLYLADDKLEGRNTGSPGHRKAAEYVAEQFERIGAKAAGTQGYFQPVSFVSRQIVESESSLEIVREGSASKVTLGQEAYFGSRVPLSKTLEAGLVFVGYGLQIPEHGVDDLAGLDLRGKIAVILSGFPRHLPPLVAAHYNTSAQRWAGLKRAGAVGVTGISTPRRMEMSWERSSATRVLPSMSFADASLLETAGQQISIVWNPAHAESLFEGSGHALKELLELDAAGKPLPRFPLTASLRAAPVFRTSQVTSDNVAAIIEGSDPKLRGEYIALSAHLDHIGARAAGDGDRIYNGAMDNASGIATLIEIGRHLSRSKPKRSILLVAVTAEEKGLLGSRYFALRPTVPAESIVANVNFDMFLPVIPLKAITAYGLAESTLGDAFEVAAREAGVAIEPDREPQRVIFTRSDQYSFIRQGVPSLSFKIAAAAKSPEEETLRQWLRTRYHGLTDDVNQPVNMEAAVKFNQLMAAFTTFVANRAEKPAWKDSSFFKRFAIRPAASGAN